MDEENIYEEIISLKNLILAWKKARKGKTKKYYVKYFEENIAYNLKLLHNELKSQTYKPKPLVTFILRDPKTRKISKSDFRDRIVHHAIVNILEPIFDKTFIYDSCANRKGKGNLFAIKRFEKFQRRVTNNLHSKAFCFKADIKHYFQEVNHEILIKIISRKVKDEKIIWLITLILKNFESNNKGMPLGNLTSQFFANIYLNELDYFVKHQLKAKYYIRYVDDFILLNSSRKELLSWGGG
ncbi:MAG: reverse transcriptase domain-containing protein [Candidatus Pacearchaeota archaeon]